MNQYDEGNHCANKESSSILLPPEVTDGAAAQEEPRTQDKYDGNKMSHRAVNEKNIKELTILWDAENCKATIKHDPNQWHCWTGIIAALEAAKVMATVNYNIFVAAMMQQQQMEMAQRQVLAKKEVGQIFQLGKNMNGRHK